MAWFLVPVKKYQFTLEMSGLEEFTSAWIVYARQKNHLHIFLLKCIRTKRSSFMSENVQKVELIFLIIKCHRRKDVLELIIFYCLLLKAHYYFRWTRNSEKLFSAAYHYITLSMIGPKLDPESEFNANWQLNRLFWAKTWVPTWKKPNIASFSSQLGSRLSLA